MRTYTIHFNPGLCLPATVVEADDLVHDGSSPFLEFRAAGGTVALAKVADVLHVEVSLPEPDRTRPYDASKVTVVNDHDKYGSRCIRLFTPTNALTWLTGAGSDCEAARAAAIDAAREYGYKTVGRVQKLGLTSDVETGRTSIEWRAEVS